MNLKRRKKKTAAAATKSLCLCFCFLTVGQFKCFTFRASASDSLPKEERKKNDEAVIQNIVVHEDGGRVLHISLTHFTINTNNLNIISYSGWNPMERCQPHRRFAPSSKPNMNVWVCVDEVIGNVFPLPFRICCGRNRIESRYSFYSHLVEDHSGSDSQKTEQKYMKTDDKHRTKCISFRFVLFFLYFCNV